MLKYSSVTQPTCSSLLCLFLGHGILCQRNIVLAQNMHNLQQQKPYSQLFGTATKLVYLQSPERSGTCTSYATTAHDHGKTTATDQLQHSRPSIHVLRCIDSRACCLQGHNVLNMHQVCCRKLATTGQHPLACSGCDHLAM